MALYKIKRTEEQFVQKYKKTFCLKYFMYMQSTNKRKQQHSTDKDTTCKLEYSPKIRKQYPFPLFKNIQTIQLPLSDIHTQDEN